MPPEFLARLLKGEHIGMPERFELGLWPHPPISLEFVTQSLTRLLQECRWFPREPAPANGVVGEGATIEHVPTGKFIYRSARSDPADPTLIVNSMERPFATAREAAEFYLRWELGLPGDLDGWKVTR